MSATVCAHMCVCMPACVSACMAMPPKSAASPLAIGAGHLGERTQQPVYAQAMIILAKAGRIRAL